MPLRCNGLQRIATQNGARGLNVPRAVADLDRPAIGRLEGSRQAGLTANGRAKLSHAERFTKGTVGFVVFNIQRVERSSNSFLSASMYADVCKE